MVGSRTLTALVGIAGSILVSIVLWWYFDTLLFFLLIPFVPFLFRGLDGQSTERDEMRIRACPECNFQTRNDEYEYCPRDGRRLQERRH